ncbi:PIG-L deacetylase family protein [Cryptosporangium phraense]|uniref:PIG-L family deacetylase n=1 Tax=Cryptosporangium phraense TaxID=2593070 RepID=A0A545AZW1_9ACTN|nr:PIG-L family deacetylase [Cryptosporangium phraense]TQS46876.1 PIG-L family deacetylase [Cryptosporangium phraense]
MSPRTVVAFHAHPDDEALLTGGTLARAAAEGHRVVLVVATVGEAGLASAGDGLGRRRWRELQRSAAALGCARVETLGYADSGLHGDAPGARRFRDVPIDEAAVRLAALLHDERADVLLSYDARGGYGHPDHVHVHHVGARAGRLAGVRVLEATIDRDALRPVLRLLRLTGRLLPRLPLNDVDTVFTDRASITHVVDVRKHLGAKRAALAAHASQAEGGPRTVGALLRLPPRVFAAVLGREWFVERGGVPGGPLDDIFADAGAQAPASR